jgi:tetratricopeptide (TPR) repeat protein
MHELVRQYGFEMLQRDPMELQQIRQRHLGYYLSLAERVDLEWDGPYERAWLDRLHSAQPNIDAGLVWGLDQRKSEPVLRMLAALQRVWVHSHPFTRYQSVLEQALGLPWNADSTTATSARARTLNGAGYAAVGIGDYRRGYQCFGEAITLYKQLGDMSAYDYSVRNYGVALQYERDLTAAERRFRHSLAICRQAGDTKGEAWSAYHLAESMFLAGRYEAANRALREVSSRFEQLGIHIGTYTRRSCSATTNANLGDSRTPSRRTGAR